MDDIIFKSKLHQEMLRDVLETDHHQYDRDTFDHWMSIDWKLSSVEFNSEYDYYFTEWENNLIKESLIKHKITTLYTEWYIDRVGLDVLEKVYSDLVQMFLG